MYFLRTVRRAPAAMTAGNNLRFDHIHIYTDAAQPLKAYQEMEKALNAFSKDNRHLDAKEAREKWKKFWPKAADPEKYEHINQDVVQQLIFGGGFRCSGHHEGGGTASFIMSLSDSDKNGFHAVVTAPSSSSSSEGSAKNIYPLENERHVNFIKQNKGRSGFGCFVFRTGTKENLEDIKAAYESLHPKLIATKDLVDVGSHRLFDAYAYYLEDNVTPDTKTVIRYMDGALLPMDRIKPEFSNDVFFGYCDHWVSNVINRTKFIDTLNDVLGFTPKVNFNAGVVGAGEAVIESTVSGNDPGLSLPDDETAFKNEQQIYLPINNALSNHGHVYAFLQEIGQGIQHIATRVNDLPRFIEQANWYREVTGEGLQFLYIPRSYYGYLRPEKLGVPEAKGKDIFSALESAKLVDSFGIVKLDITDEQIRSACGDLPTNVAKEIKRSRYNNIHDLLGERLDEATYLRCVRNQVLMDVQENDVLFQIFTNPVLTRSKLDQGPFFEFIQRICHATADLKAGCGGFGIRNFLTLFLSIEVSKAMEDAAQSLKVGDTRMYNFHNERIKIFSVQQDESNPILTRITEAMTAEAEFLEQAKNAVGAEKDSLLEEAKKFEKLRAAGEAELTIVGEHFKQKMRDLKPAEI